MIDPDPALGPSSSSAQQSPRQHNRLPRWAALAAAPGIRNPAVGAHRLLTCARDSVRAPPSLGRVPPVLLSGDGARRWCEKQQLATAGEETSLAVYQVTDGARRQWEWCRTQEAAANAANAAAKAAADTAAASRVPVAAATCVDGAEAANSSSPVDTSDNDTDAIDTGVLHRSPNVSGYNRVDTVGAVVIDHCGRVAAGAQHTTSSSLFKSSNNKVKEADRKSVGRQGHPAVACCTSQMDGLDLQLAMELDVGLPEV
eukprot:COSAG02_NODE_981_length_15488_cov_27.585093_3_plen_257_part_00